MVVGLRQWRTKLPDDDPRLGRWEAGMGSRKKYVQVYGLRSYWSPSVTSFLSAPKHLPQRIPTCPRRRCLLLGGSWTPNRSIIPEPIASAYGSCSQVAATKVFGVQVNAGDWCNPGFSPSATTVAWRRGAIRAGHIKWDPRNRGAFGLGGLVEEGWSPTELLSDRGLRGYRPPLEPVQGTVMLIRLSRRLSLSWVTSGWTHS